MQRRRFGAAIGYSDADQNIVWHILCIFCDYIKITVVVEDARVG